MRQALLTRTRTGDSGTFGELRVNGTVFATGELPDRGNAQGLSSIPPGTYTCGLTWSNKHGELMYEILNVPGRTGVRFDVGNWCGDKTLGLRADVQGCVLLGEAVKEVSGQPGVTNSSESVDEFTRIMAGETFQLTILNEYQETGTPEVKNVG